MAVMIVIMVMVVVMRMVVVVIMVMALMVVIVPMRMIVVMSMFMPMTVRWIWVGSGAHDVRCFEAGMGRRALSVHKRTSAIAAPKPLSMFTTVTPAAQLDSIPSKAARPPSDAP